jgi:hypothetical protein
MVSYAGFVVSAVLVARVHRRQAGPMLGLRRFDVRRADGLGVTSRS